MTQIDRIRSVPHAAGSDCEAAYAVHFDSGPDPHMTVEYASGGGGAHASEGHARRVVQQYLNDENRPRRLIVGRDGTVRPA